jgi:L-amino acid N-acyltransferase YncA
VLFYLVATRLLGGWTPMDVSYSNLYATPFPFLSPITTGLAPAVEEELLYRLVGIGLILGLTKKRWLALLIPGLLWGFAHASYVRDPIYFRGIELTLSAIFVMGVFFLTFDLTTTIIGHMTYNAMLGALPMLRSGEPYFVFSGLVVILFLVSPVLPGLVQVLWQKLRGVSPSAEPELLPGRVEDLPALLELPVKDADWAAWLEDPQSVVVCLKQAGRTVGAAAGRLNGQEGDLLTVYVASALRGRYLGSLLVDAVGEALTARGALQLRASAAVQHRTSLAFLSSQGWQGNLQIFNPGPVPTFQLSLDWTRKQLQVLRKRFMRS